MTGQEGRQVPPAETNHAAFDHEQLKQWTDDADTSASQTFADEWTRTGTALVDAAETLKRAVVDSEAGWTGEAADAMRSRLGQISAWSGGTGSQIAAASQSVARQSEAADTARRSMPEPVPYDPAQMIRDAGRGGLLGMATLPQQLFAQKQKHDAAHAEAVRVVAERDAAMSAAAANVALFRPPPALDGPADERAFVDSGDLSGAGGDGGGSGGARGPAAAGWPGGGSGGGSGGGADPGTGGPRPGHGGSVNGGAPAPGGGHGTGTASPGTTTPGSFGPGPEPAPVGVVPPGAASASPAGGTAGLGVGGTPGGVGGGGATSGGLGSGGAGSGTRGGTPGPGVGRGAGLPATSPGTAVTGAGVRGGGAVGGLPMGAGAGRRAEDDAEHQRAEFLQEPDPDGIFDSDVLTAPSVIGGPDDE